MKQKVKNRIVYIWDNNGETLDRYTILIASTGDIYGASENSYSPMGFAQYCGNAADSYMIQSYGYGWRSRCNVKACIREAVAHYAANNDAIGAPVLFDALNTSVQNYIKSLI